jgi:hypothetical protein
MAAVKTGSFTSSVVTTLDSWRAFVEHDPEPVTLLTEAELGRLPLQSGSRTTTSAVTTTRRCPR